MIWHLTVIKVVAIVIRALGTYSEETGELLVRRNVNAEIELAALRSKTSLALVSAIIL